jgi:hypothetical protein
MADMALKSTAMKSLAALSGPPGHPGRLRLFMVGFTLWNPRFIDIDNVFGVSGPRRSSGSWRLA